MCWHTVATPASAKKPLSQVQVFVLLAGQVSSHRVAMLVPERGIGHEKSYPLAKSKLGHHHLG